MDNDIRKLWTCKDCKHFDKRVVFCDKLRCSVGKIQHNYGCVHFEKKFKIKDMKKSTWLLISTIVCVVMFLGCLIAHEELELKGSGVGMIVSGSAALVAFGVFMWLFKQGK